MAFKKHKPYGEVCGTGVPYKYDQAGKYYDHQFNEVTIDGVRIPGGEYIKPEDERKAQEPVVEQPAEEFKGIAMDADVDVPEIGLEETTAADVPVTSDDIDTLSAPDLREMLDRLDIKYPKKMLKPDLKALLQSELAALDAEKDEKDAE